MSEVNKYLLVTYGKEKGFIILKDYGTKNILIKATPGH